MKNAICGQPLRWLRIGTRKISYEIKIEEKIKDDNRGMVVEQPSM